MTVLCFLVLMSQGFHGENSYTELRLAMVVK